MKSILYTVDSCCWGVQLLHFKWFSSRRWVIPTLICLIIFPVIDQHFLLVRANSWRSFDAVLAVLAASYVPSTPEQMTFIGAGSTF